MKEGCVYCSVCGHEAKIVADYNVLEDDYLRTLLSADAGMPAADSRDTDAGKKTGKPDGAGKSAGNSAGRHKKKNNKLPILIVCILLVVGISAGIVIKVSIDKRNANSYDYQVDMAQKEAFSGNFEKALDYYGNALALQPNDIPVRMAMEDIYVTQQQYDAAIVVLQEVIDIDRAYKKAYQELIAIYEKNQDYDKIVELSAGLTDVSVLELFEDYLVAPPIISPLGNTYEIDIEITLFSVENFDIYYTLDGTTPNQTDGILYDPQKTIVIDEEGTYELKAVCYNEKDICSDVASETYKLKYEPPGYPTVMPDGGRVEDGESVTIRAEEYCNIYYTWDNTDPTPASAKYEEPLEIPEGKSVLSVLVVDTRTGLDSGIYRTNFTKN